MLVINVYGMMGHVFGCVFPGSIWCKFPFPTKDKCHNLKQNIQTLLKSMVTILLFAPINILDEGPCLGVPEQLLNRGPLETISIIVKHS